MEILFKKLSFTIGDDMKIGSIGDIHSKEIWQSIIASNPHIEKWIFMGDYVDDYPPTTDAEILQNLYEIIRFKKLYPDKVVLLTGNHESSYIDIRLRCSGFRESMFPILNQTLQIEKDLFQYAFQIKNYIWTHAGINKSWYEKFVKAYQNLNYPFDDLTIADQINAAAKTNLVTDALNVVGASRGGWSQFGGPLWADRREFNYGVALLDGYHQIVGHSKVPEIKTNIYEGKSITFVDCLDSVDKFYELEID